MFALNICSLPLAFPKNISIQNNVNVTKITIPEEKNKTPIVGMMTRRTLFCSITVVATAL